MPARRHKAATLSWQQILLQFNTSRRMQVNLPLYALCLMTHKLIRIGRNIGTQRYLEKMKCSLINLTRVDCAPHEPNG
jgi:hypothetical protein